MLAEDKKLMDEMNSVPVGYRLKLVIKMLEQSVEHWDYMEPFQVEIVENSEMFHIAIKLLENMSENDGKVNWK